MTDPWICHAYDPQVQRIIKKLKQSAEDLEVFCGGQTAGRITLSDLAPYVLHSLLNFCERTALDCRCALALRKEEKETLQDTVRHAGMPLDSPVRVYAAPGCVRLLLPPLVSRRNAAYRKNKASGTAPEAYHMKTYVTGAFHDCEKACPGLRFFGYLKPPLTVTVVRHFPQETEYAVPADNDNTEFGNVLNAVMQCIGADDNPRDLPVITVKAVFEEGLQTPYTEMIVREAGRQTAG